MYVFLLIKILRCDNTADNTVFKMFFVISFPPCVPTTLASLPPGVMSLNRSIAPGDSATNIKRTS